MMSATDSEIKGYLYKWVNYIHGFCRRYFILANHELLYFKSIDDMSTECRGVINIANCKLKSIDSKNFKLQTSSGKNIHLRSNDMEEITRWYGALEVAIQKYKNVAGLQSRGGAVLKKDSLTRKSSDSYSSGAEIMTDCDKYVTELKETFSKLQGAIETVKKNSSEMNRLVQKKPNKFNNMTEESIDASTSPSKKVARSAQANSLYQSRNTIQNSRSQLNSTVPGTSKSKHARNRSTDIKLPNHKRKTSESNSSIFSKNKTLVNIDFAGEADQPAAVPTIVEPSVPSTADGLLPFTPNYNLIDFFDKLVFSTDVIDSTTELALQFIEEAEKTLEKYHKKTLAVEKALHYKNELLERNVEHLALNLGKFENQFVLNDKGKLESINKVSTNLNRKKSINKDKTNTTDGNGSIVSSFDVDDDDEFFDVNPDVDFYSDSEDLLPEKRESSFNTHITRSISPGTLSNSKSFCPTLNPNKSITASNNISAPKLSTYTDTTSLISPTQITNCNSEIAIFESNQDVLDQDQNMGKTQHNRAVSEATFFSSKSKHRSIIPDKPNVRLNLWNFIKNLIGKDLTKIPMPINFNEPLSMLQRVTESLEYSKLLDLAASSSDPLTQLLYVSVFTISQYTNAAQRTGKPFNPLLYETYELDRSEDLGWRAITEQVTHHPPACSMHVQGRKWVLNESFSVQSKFRGKHITVNPLGVQELIISDGSENKNRYSWSRVTTIVNNIIVGSINIELSGTAEIVNHTTGDLAILKYHTLGLFSRGVARKVTGTILDSNGIPKFSIQGTWDGSIEYAFIKENSKVDSIDPASYKNIWKANPLPLGSERRYNFSEFTCSLNEPVSGIAPTDSRNRMDQRLMEEGDFDASNKLKVKLEEKQRERRKKLQKEQKIAASLDDDKDDSETHEITNPRWFTVDQNTDLKSSTTFYRYKGGYWESKLTQKWDGIVPIYDVDESTK